MNKLKNNREMHHLIPPLTDDCYGLNFVPQGGNVEWDLLSHADYFNRFSSLKTADGCC